MITGEITVILVADYWKPKLDSIRLVIIWLETLLPFKSRSFWLDLCALLIIVTSRFNSKLIKKTDTKETPWVTMNFMLLLSRLLIISIPGISGLMHILIEADIFSDHFSFNRVVGSNTSSVDGEVEDICVALEHFLTRNKFFAF